MIFSSIRFMVSKAPVDEMPSRVSAMVFCASALFARATRRFFFRLASSILPPSCCSAVLS